MTNVEYYGDAVHKIQFLQNASGKLMCFQQINRKEIQERDGSGNFQIKSDLQATSINHNVSILCGTCKITCVFSLKGTKITKSGKFEYYNLGLKEFGEVWFFLM